jgi:hypothetical protein
MYNKNEIINEIEEEVKNEMNSDNLYQNLGTIVQQGMGREETKDIRADFNLLCDVLKEKLNLNLEDQITNEQLAKLYELTKEQYKWKDFDFDEDYQKSVFSLLNHPNEKYMLVKDFIKEYILLKNKMQIKEGTLSQLFDNLNENKETYENQIKRHKQHIEKGNIEKIKFGITVFEASDFGFSEDKATYIVRIKCEDKEENTNAAKLNPSDGYIVWNENFSFELKNRNQQISIEIIRTQITSSTFGTCTIDLEQIDSNQQRVENIFPLNNRSLIQVGKIRLKLHYVYDIISYFSYLLKNVKNKIANIESDLTNLKKFQEYYDKPFGIIMSGGIYDLIDDNIGTTIFDKYKDTDNLRETLRKSIIKTHGNRRFTEQLFINSSNPTSNNMIINDQKNPFSKFKDSSVTETINKEKNNVKKYLLYLILLGIILSFFNCSDRNDLLNFLAFCIYLILYLTNGKYDNNYLNYIFYFLIVTEILDLIWLLSNISTYLGHYGFDSILRSVIYLSSFINFINKAIIAFSKYFNKN